MLSVLFMAALCAGFVSCDDEADDVDGKTMQITNGSNLTLYSFTVIYGDVNGNVMFSDVKGDLYPGDKTTVRVPVGASQFFMGYYDKQNGVWLYSAVYDVGRKTFFLNTQDVSQWTAEP